MNCATSKDGWSVEPRSLLIVSRSTWDLEHSWKVSSNKSSKKKNMQRTPFWSQAQVTTLWAASNQKIDQKTRGNKRFRSCSLRQRCLIKFNNNPKPLRKIAKSSALMTSLNPRRFQTREGLQQEWRAVTLNCKLINATQIATKTKMTKRSLWMQCRRLKLAPSKSHQNQD